MCDLNPNLITKTITIIIQCYTTIYNINQVLYVEILVTSGCKIAGILNYFRASAQLFLDFEAACQIMNCSGVHYNRITYDSILIVTDVAVIIYYLLYTRSVECGGILIA